jgi:hypothetical protein
MEIVYGPVLLACAIQSAVFGILFALLFPAIAKRLGSTVGGLSRRAGLALLAGGLFGLAHLVIVCAADGFPPRIIQSAAIMLALAAALGLGMIARAGNQPATT